MTCVHMVLYLLVFNERQCDWLVLIKRPKQGNPLSSYRFFLCQAQRISHLLFIFGVSFSLNFHDVIDFEWNEMMILSKKNKMFGSVQKDANKINTLST